MVCDIPFFSNICYDRESLLRQAKERHDMAQPQKTGGQAKALHTHPAANYLLTLFIGMMISTMVVFNGKLSDRVGAFSAVSLIHLVGLVCTSLILLYKREMPRTNGAPPFLFTAGTIGVGITICNNLAFGRISVSAMMALGLLGESITSLLADHFGVMGLARRPFKQHKLWGMLLNLCGILVMLTDFQLVPVLVSLLAGAGIVGNRLVNSQLARHTTTRVGVFYNYLGGFIASLFVLLLTGTRVDLAHAATGPVYIYLGGLFGVIIVLISNHVVRKIPSLYMTMTLFVGQVLAGVLLDMLLTQSLPLRNMLGGLFVLCGLLLNLWQDRRAN